MKNSESDTISTRSFMESKERLVKVCGMKYPGNIQAVAALHPDFMGFIFYTKSPRFAEPLSLETLAAIPASIKKIGVFVNEDLENILTVVYKYKLNGVQLHGSEMVSMCAQLKEAGLIVIKAFPIAEAINFIPAKRYEGVCDYFLFDTKGHLPGGTGQKFNWALLKNYTGSIPFFLSGGIGPDDLEAIRNFDHPRWRGLDVNSGFEIAPALKDVVKVQQFIFRIRNNQ